MSEGAHFDVAIVGGGPSGSTVGALVKLHAPHLSVCILEREIFPRDHIGESLLPPINGVLHEMGVWDRIEAADFPIKVGATYRWGKHKELWDFDFLPKDTFRDEPRPAKFVGQRQMTAFQVERAKYDEILLNRAQELGCEVRQGTMVKQVHHTDRHIDALELANGERITAKHYVDGSGNAGLFQKALDIAIDAPTTLRNIAIWDYWQNADWAVHIGVGGTRIQIMSLGWGWIWFIPMGPTRTSIGLVVPAEYYKQTGLRPSEIYEKALQEEPRISELLKNATSEGKLESTKDWSFLAENHYGSNWFLVGECSGFADPILSAGVTMAQVSARQLAYTIAEIERGEHPADWLKEQFELGQKERVLTHIRFGDYWYTANSQFTDLQGFTAQLAKDAGLDLTPDKAWAWIAQGGFITTDLRIGTGGFDIPSTLKIGEFLSDLDVTLNIEKNNVFKLNLEGAKQEKIAVYHQGRVHKEPCYVRGNRILPLYSQVGLLVDMLQRESRLPVIMGQLQQMAQRSPFVAQAIHVVPEAIEAMIADGWLHASYDPKLPLTTRKKQSKTIRLNEDTDAPTAPAI